MKLNILPDAPISRIISDVSWRTCNKCGSSLKFSIARWFSLANKLAPSCIHPACEDYYDRKHAQELSETKTQLVSFLRVWHYLPLPTLVQLVKAKFSATPRDSNRLDVDVGVAEITLIFDKKWTTTKVVIVKVDKKHA